MIQFTHLMIPRTKKPPNPRDLKMNGDLLARELLAELPNQVVQYMTMIDKPPGQFVSVNIEQAMHNQQM